jgi:hypothetical protein
MMLMAEVAMARLKRDQANRNLDELARLIHEPAALGRAGFDVSVAA